ncbi:DUF1214 domain-containing protein [Maricaulis salignorans]|uniref:DUF1214 domain-containing protein n=1 Tax=Maricaulis salignorans TaxID=144026 RepID=UPI003A8F1F75
MWIKTGMAALAGLAGGALLAVLLVFGPFEIGGTASGPWRTNLLIGDPAASPTVRAAIARRGLLALNRSETVYFNATSDENGQRLRENCTYRISFDQQPDSRWWSLTLYAGDDYLAVNGDNAHSITAEHAADSMDVVVAASRPEAPAYWMSSRHAGDFALTLRLYQPDPAISDDPLQAPLPRINRLSCEDQS